MILSRVLYFRWRVSGVSFGMLDHRSLQFTKVLGAGFSNEVGFVKVLVESVCVCVCVCGTSRFCLVGNPLIRVEESRNKSGCWFVNCERDGRNAEQIFEHDKVGTWRENKMPKRTLIVFRELGNLLPMYRVFLR